MNYLFGYMNLVFIVSLFIHVRAFQYNASSPWMREKVLDDPHILHDPLDKAGKVVIRWNYTNDYIKILVVGKTRGWIAMGFGTDRKNMSVVDFVVAWVENGKSYIQDRHLEGSKLVLDKHQDYKVIGASENDTETSICFQRKLKTCDKQDSDITFSTVITYWALGKADPKNKTADWDLKDALKRGQKDVHYLMPMLSKPNISETETFEITTRNVSIISNDGTKYWCTHMKYPKTPEQHYMVGWEPKIQKENMPYVHHFILYICPTVIMTKLFSKIDPNGYDCLDEEKIEYSSACVTVLSAWAVGGQGEFYPTDIAFPIGSVKEDSFFKLEVHYSFPDDIKSIQDSSGLRIYHTKNLKPQYEAGIFPVGIHVTPFHVMPPGLQAVDTIGVCETKCLQQKLPNGGITVFMIGFHTHLTGRKVIFRRFRNGTELEPIGDYNFDFEFQGLMLLDKPFNITKDDILMTECIYDTTNLTNTTVGNYPTKSEMCLTFLAYYPKTDLTACLSMLPPQKIYDMVGIQQVKQFPKESNCTESECPVPLSKPSVSQLLRVLKPNECNNKTVTECIQNFKSWTKEKVNTLNDLYYDAQQAVCWDNNGTFLSTEKDQAMFPKKASIFKAIDVCQNN